ncbi:MAG: methyltransferase domain-containing protein [Mariprofundaceae bacterium]
MATFGFYRKFTDGIPIYLARYYWWAYLWKYGVWLFDHQPIINAILFGQYNRLMHETLQRFDAKPAGKVLQLTCVYGKLTTELLPRVPEGMHLADVADIQLKLARRKTQGLQSRPMYPARMNAEYLGYKDNIFDTIVLFFLLHEMPPEARQRTLSEAMRVLKPGGRILITEYGELPERHLLYRFPPFRWLLGRLEPFLPGFWREDMDEELKKAGRAHSKPVIQTGQEAQCFSHFYRVSEFRITTEPSPDARPTR